MLRAMETITPSRLYNDNLLTQYKCFLNTKQKLQEYASDGERICIDFRQVDWFTPAFLAPLSVVYNQMVDRGVDIEIIRPNDYRIREYLNQICFPTGTANPTNQYRNHIPLCLMNTGENDNIIESIGRKVRDLIMENYSDFSSGAIDAVTYPIKEIIDNVDQHSQCEYGSLLIQHTPNKPFLTICIADNGISIPGNYQSHEIEYGSDLDAIRKALAGHSTSPESGYHRGLGIRTTLNMICDGLDGEVIISSGNGTIWQNENQDPISRFSDKSWNGTIFIGRLYEPSEDFDYIQYLTLD